jgi:hypothetical protein
MSPHTVTGVRTGWMFDSAGCVSASPSYSLQYTKPWAHAQPATARMAPEPALFARHTFHETLLDNLTQALHISFRQVLARLRLLQPLVGPRALGEAGGARLGHIAFFGCHDLGLSADGGSRCRGRGSGESTAVDAAMAVQRGSVV